VTINEMHIAINLGIQKLGSFQVDNLLPEEIDHELNLAQRRFIKQRYSELGNAKRKGFEQSQKRIDDLRNLIEDFYSPSTSFMGAVYSSRSKGDILGYRVKLPTDYMHLINIRAKIFELCHKIVPFKTTKLEYYYLKVNITPPTRGYKLVEINIANSSGTLTAVKANPGGITLDDLRNGAYGLGIEPSLSPNDGFSDLTSAAISADSPIADANEIFFKRDKAFNQSNDVEYFGAYGTLVWKNPQTEETLVININQGPYIVEEIQREVTPSIIKATPGIKLKRTLCKYSQHDDLYAILDDPFNSTKSSSPLYTIQENFVDLYTTNEFIPQDIFIKYLRRPALMSYQRGIGSELSEHTHDEVIEMAVKSILEAIESPRYQSQSGEVLESE
jgi:hypothetical protein